MWNWIGNGVKHWKTVWICNSFKMMCNSFKKKVSPVFEYKPDRDSHPTKVLKKKKGVTLKSDLMAPLCWEHTKLSHCLEFCFCDSVDLFSLASKLEPMNRISLSLLNQQIPNQMYHSIFFGQTFLWTLSDISWFLKTAKTLNDIVITSSHTGSYKKVYIIQSYAKDLCKTADL